MDEREGIYRKVGSGAVHLAGHCFSSGEQESENSLGLLNGSGSYTIAYSCNSAQLRSHDLMRRLNRGDLASQALLPRRIRECPCVVLITPSYRCWKLYVGVPTQMGIKDSMSHPTN